MTPAVLIVLVMFALVLSVVNADAARKPDKISAARFGSRCSDAYAGVRWYRARYNEHRTRLGFSLASPVEQAMNCRRLRERAAYWVRAAKVNRQAVERRAKRIRLEQARIPRGEAELRAYINDDCLEEIVDRETADTWNPQVYNYQGSGAYGLPQALPGHKMASAGADWRTNPKTQIAWMRRYVDVRYGGSCNALAHHNSQGWY